MAEAFQNIGNLWDQLSDLHQKDPEKYKEVIEESAKEYAKLKLPPLPHTCVLVRDENQVTFFVNILAWERLPEDRNGALPIAGGFLTRKFEKVIYSLAINNNVMNQIMVKGSVEEKNDLINLALEFLKSRNEELKISQDSWSLIRGKDFEGNLNEIQQLFMASNSKSLLKTENPKSLLTQLDQKEEIVEKEKDDFKLQTCPESRKRLVQEVHNSGKKTEFEENLKRKYTKENGSSNVKLFEADKSQLSAISSKKLIPKKPLFGRAFCPKSQEVRLKFLLNGVEDIKDVFFYLPEEGFFGLQTANGYSIKDQILPGVTKEWEVYDQNLDLGSNYPVFCIKLIVKDKENNV